MPEWLVERGIGETRAALVDDGDILEARIELERVTPAGTVLAARLVAVGANCRNAVARDECGTKYLLPRGAPGISQGAQLTIEVTREAFPGGESWKRPLARLSEQQPRAVGPLTDRLGGRELIFPAARDELAEAGWNELVEQARNGIAISATQRLSACVHRAG